MAHEEHGTPPPEKQTPIEVEGAPEEEDLDVADVADRAELDPDDQVNRPDQPEADSDEREQL